MADILTKGLKPYCKYGSKCYQKNPEHIKKYKHPHQNNTTPDKSPTAKRRKLHQSTESLEKSPIGQNNLIDDKQNVSLEPVDDFPVIGTIEADKNTQKDTVIDNIMEHPDIGTIKTIIEIDGKTHNDTVIENSIDKITESHNKVSIKTIDIPNDPAELIKELFLVDMPKDFYSFWEFCSFLSKDNDISNVFKSINLKLVGPFDVLLGNLVERHRKTDYLLHWRYFYDPPEFQTLLMSPGSSDYHIGYYRDSPLEKPCFVASNEAAKDCKIKPIGENLFAALLSYLENMKKKSPFSSVACQKFLGPLKEWAQKYNFPLVMQTPEMKKREKLVVAKTFHGAGIVVPYDKKTQLGYRPLIESNATIKSLISSIVEAENDEQKKSAFSKLQPIINMANIATDEYDFGTGFELGLAFFCTGEKIFNSSALNLFTIAYSMLERDVFGTIIKVHLENRRKGSKLSVTDL